MTWIIFTISSVLLLTIISIFDKFIVSKELKDPILDTFFSTLVLSLMFIVLSLFGGQILFTPKLIILAVLAGIFHGCALLIYFKALVKIEVSRFIPLFSIMPIFILIYAALFFNETFPIQTYIGFVLIILGAFLISTKKIKSVFSLNTALFMGVGVAFLFAVRNILMKTATLNSSVWQIFFWIGIGTALVSVTLLAIHHPHLKEKAKKGAFHVMVNSILAGLALLLLTIAISKGPISIISIIMEIQPASVFIITALLSLFIPKIIKEKISKKILIQKTISILIIIIGTVLIAF